MTDADHDQENADFTILEESLEGLRANLTSVERRQVNNEEKIQYVDSKVATLSARVDGFEKSCITADEMQKQVHEMREDFDRLKTRVEKLNQSVKCEMAKSLKDMQSFLDELDETVTTFRQEINLKMSRKSALLKEHFQLGEKNISDNVAWKATYEGRVNALELELSRVKGKQAHFSSAVRNDVTKLQKTMEELQLECTPDHSSFTEGLTGMELLFSSLQDKVEELGTEIAGTQMVTPSLQDELYGPMETPEAAKPPVTQGFLIGMLLTSTRAAMHGLGNRLKVCTARHSWGLLLQRTTDQVPIAMRRSTRLWLLAAGIFVFAIFYAIAQRQASGEAEMPISHALLYGYYRPAGFSSY